VKSHFPERIFRRAVAAGRQCANRKRRQNQMKPLLSKYCQTPCRSFMRAFPAAISLQPF
jgi:hypothetical protein